MTTSKKAVKRRVKAVAKRAGALKGNRLTGRKPDPELHLRKRVAGGGTGALVGAAVAGPVGAVVGGIVGTVVGAAAETVSVKGGESSHRSARSARTKTSKGRKSGSTATRKLAASRD
jgi:hypothetical protein